MSRLASSGMSSWVLIRHGVLRLSFEGGQHAQARLLELVDPPFLNLVEWHGVEVVEPLPTTSNRADQIRGRKEIQVLGGRLAAHVDGETFWSQRWSSSAMSRLGATSRYASSRMVATSSQSTPCSPELSRNTPSHSANVPFADGDGAKKRLGSVPTSSSCTPRLGDC